MKRYEIEVLDSGLVVRGAIPIGDMEKISKMAVALGFDSMDLGVASALEATLVITNAEGSVMLRQEIEASLVGKSAEDAWIGGCDTGTSSKTIFGVMTGRPMLDRTDVPHDPSDFGRCYRLLEKFPAWRPRLSEVAKKFPKWAPLVDAWDELTTLYEEELPLDRMPKLYQRMHELLA